MRTTEAIYKMCKWDLGILDESHNIKTPNAAVTKAALKLRDRCDKRMCLTGTPVTNHPLDLWTQLEFLGHGYSGFHTWKAFKSYFGIYDQRENGFETLIGIQNKPFLKERLTAHSFIISKKEALPDLPDKTYDTVEVEMSEEQRKIYTDVASNILAELEEETDTPQQLVVTNILTRMLRLAQITSGFVVYNQDYDENNDPLPRQIDRIDPNPKLEM